MLQVFLVQVQMRQINGQGNTFPHYINEAHELIGKVLRSIM